MDDNVVAVAIISIITFAIVLKSWINHHYNAKRLSSPSLNADETVLIEELVSKMEVVHERIANLEKILDQNHQGWRK